MKKLLILALCGMLAVPGVKMNVQATAGTPAIVSIPTPEELEKLAKDVANEINSYYENKDFSESGKKNADVIMTQVAKDLDYEIKNELLSKKVDSSVDKISDLVKKDSLGYVKNIKSKFDGCATIPEKVVVEVPVEPEKKIENNSNIIIGGKEYDTTTANAGQHCEIAVPLVNLGETDVTNVVITPALSGDAAA